MSATGTVLRFTLSQSLLNTLATPLAGSLTNNINAYAFWWTPDAAGNNTVLHNIPLSLNGTAQINPQVNPADGTSTGTNNALGTYDAWLPNPYNSAKIYFAIQSTNSTTPPNLTSVIHQQSDINWNAAAANSYRFDSVELNLANGSGDVANLTAVNGFGLPMSLSVSTTFSTTMSGLISTTTNSAGFNVTGNGIFADAAAINPPGTNAVTFMAGSALENLRSRMVESPTVAVGNTPTLPGYSPSEWSAYVDSLTGPGTSGSGLVYKDIVVSGYFNGAKDAAGVWHNAGYYSPDRQ